MIEILYIILVVFGFLFIIIPLICFVLVWVLKWLEFIFFKLEGWNLI